MMYSKTEKLVWIMGTLLGCCVIAYIVALFGRAYVEIEGYGIMADMIYGTKVVIYVIAGTEIVRIIHE